MRRTKIVATLGPASESPDVLRGMLAAGTDVVRMNFSHGTVADHQRRLAAVRRLSATLNRPLGVMVDLPGAKIRIGALPEGAMTLRRGATVMLVPDGGPARDSVITVAYTHLLDDVRPGQRIFLQDGNIELIAREVSPAGVSCTVESGGRLREHAGVTLPGIRLQVPVFTDDDRRYMEWALSHDVDFIALSFVERAEDIEHARALVASREAKAQLVAKVERRLAVEHIEEIVAASDGIMVARGDLAVETSIEEVPLIQKQIIALCNAAGVPVITATQMLESMVTQSRPTRAEAADVANAVLDGTDALMLSAETAIGAHPIESVAAMAAIAQRAETGLPHEVLLRERRRRRASETGEAIALAACEAAEAVGAAAIVASTDSGSTARRVSRFRPRRPIVAVTHTPVTYRQLALVWGVWPIMADPVADQDALVARGVRAAVDLGVAGPGDLVVVTAGFPIGRPGTTNFLKVVRVEREEAAR